METGVRRVAKVLMAFGFGTRGAALFAAVALAVAAAATALPVPASANSCADQCRAAHNQCRIQTKGSPSCDAALTQCLRSCTGK